MMTRPMNGRVWSIRGEPSDPPFFLFSSSEENNQMTDKLDLTTLRASLTDEERARLSDTELTLAAVFYAKLDGHEKGFGRNHPGQSSCECLRCQTGIIKYSVASNGHAAGKCSTPQCVAWLE